MSDTPKSPAQVINDLSDQVRLLRQDVTNLTATATTKKEAAALRAAVQASVEEAHDRSAKVLSRAEQVINETHHATLAAARDGATKGVAGLQDEVRAAANRMRLEALKGSRQALYWSGGVFAVAGGLVALGALLGVLGHIWLQGRADARAFGEHPKIFCKGAGGEFMTSPAGDDACVIWLEPPAAGK
ncbi:hypothetical protein [Paracoccus sanguinis]|uniref:hypothetical protein n=1 Tax=Paracoccus sanguinis TaxID=1545044 RepID=UPI0014525C08|nr:hypothetical protein [Paracoccus sanguinis]QJD18547.1 hypothetical protein HGN31_16220 [Paracoccus sanguinis]